MERVKPKVRLMACTPEPEKVVAAAAKLCYSQSSAIDLSEKMTNVEAAKFLNRLPLTHLTPLEGAVFTFSVEGIDRATANQIVRHRMASYNQRSQRYVPEGDFNYVVPVEIEKYGKRDGFGNKTIDEIFDEAMNASKLYYNILLDKLVQNGVPEKVAQENARAVLPNACETKMIITMNARELRHFFNQRCCNRAQNCIHNVADQMFEICCGVAPALFRDAGPFCVGGACPEGDMTCGKQVEMRAHYKKVSAQANEG